MKVAIVHDWLVNLSGAERVLSELCDIFPKAPVYTLFYDKKFTSRYFPNLEIKASFLQKIPKITKYYKYFLFLMPPAIESLDLSEYDLIVSSSAIFSKGLVLKPKTKHICYCYSPTRQLWDLNVSNRKNNKIIDLSKHLMRIWDRQASERVDEFVAISEHVRKRIKKYYKKESSIIFPPVKFRENDKVFEIDNKFKNTFFKDYYLIVSRLYPHKNIDIVIEAFNKLNLPLLIIGAGPDADRLNSNIEHNKPIKMIGFVSDNDLPYYYQNCKAFIMPQEEDFGLTPIEAMFFGKPVLALKKGGALEILIEGKTGEFFDDPIPEALADGIRRLNDNFKSYNPEFIKHQSLKFSNGNFKQNILDLVSETVLN